MKYDFTIQPMPVRIPGIEADNDAEAQRKLQDIMDSQTDKILEAVRQSRWTVTLVHQSETYIGTSTADMGVEATEKSEARTDDILDENLFA